MQRAKGQSPLLLGTKKRDYRAEIYPGVKNVCKYSPTASLEVLA